MTLIEVTITAALVGMIGIAMGTSMIFALRMQRNNMRVAQITQYARKFTATIGNDVRQANAATVTDEGKTLQLTIPNASGGGSRTARWRYVDLDNNFETIDDNIIRYEFDTSAAGSQPVDYIKYVSPVTGTPIFRYTSNQRSVRIVIRLGDNNESASTRASSDAITGPGLQMMVVDITYQHRN
ncbi:MAG: hypothetical protein Kow0059_05530 [Candidatus Sumerlaeia bacterium]